MMMTSFVMLYLPLQVCGYFPYHFVDIVSKKSQIMRRTQWTRRRCCEHDEKCNRIPIVLEEVIRLRLGHLEDNLLHQESLQSRLS